MIECKECHNNIANKGKKPILVAGFPGVGKSFIYQNNTDIKIIDSDSSKYSHTIIKPGIHSIPNKDFPNNYINMIKELMEDTSIDLIMVSTHEVVRNALIKEKIPFTIVYPDKKFKDEYIGRYYKRGSSDSLIKLISDNFENWVDDIGAIDNEYVIKVKLDQYGMYLNDVIEKILDR